MSASSPPDADDADDERPLRRSAARDDDVDDERDAEDDEADADDVADCAVSVIDDACFYAVFCIQLLFVLEQV